MSSTATSTSTQFQRRGIAETSNSSNEIVPIKFLKNLPNNTTQITVIRRP